MTTRTRILTGITTTGTPHLGNYAGAIRPAIVASRDSNADSFYFLADYHALIKCDDPLRIQRSRQEIAATWLAGGLDVERVTFYRQSDIPEIPELTWLLTCVAAKGCSTVPMPIRLRWTRMSRPVKTRTPASPWACTATRY